MPRLHSQSFLTAELGDQEFLQKEQWPPFRPNLNPCDYFLWGIVEREANRTHHPNISQQKDAIRSPMISLGRGIVAKARNRFRGRLETVVEKEGKYFE